MSSIQMLGMASGLDTKAIVESMLEAEKSKIDKASQDKQILEWRQELYREMVSNVRDFTKKYFDPINKDTFIMGSGALSSITATSDVSNTMASIIASSNAVPGNYTLNVLAMAESAKVSGSKPINQATVKGDLNIPVIIDSNNDGISINGTSIEIEQKAYKNNSELAKEINLKIEANSDLKGKYKAEVKENGEIEIASKVTINDENSKLKVTVGDIDYNLNLSKKDYTPEELVKEIESKLKSSTGSDGNKFSSTDVKFKVENGQVITEGATLDKEFKSPKVDLTGTELGTSGSDTSVSGNKLSYKKEFVSGVNSELVISVRGETPIIVDLSKVDVTGTKEEALKNISDEINKNSNTVKTEIIDGDLTFKTTSKEQIIVSGTAANSIGIGNSLDMTLDINAEKMSSVINFEDPNNKKVEFKINGQTFKYDFAATEDTDEYKAGADLTIKQVFSDISSKADVNMSYNSISRTFSIESKTTGNEVSLEGSDVNGNFLGSIFGTSELKAQGKNSTVEFSDSEGNKNTFDFASNKFNLSGIDFDIKSMPTEPIKVSVTNDPDKTVELVKGFVEDYNKIIEDLNVKTKETTNRKYKPLTEEQKNEMTEEEIELWEKKAKQGLLGDEAGLESFMNELRNAIFTPVDGSNISLQQIGLDTSKDYKEGGKLVFDEEKFRQALSDDPQAVTEIFTKTSNSGNELYDPNLSLEEKEAKNADQGIFRRINDILNDYTRTTRDKSGKKGIFIEIAGISGDTSMSQNTISKAILEQEKKIDKFTDLMTLREERYYKQFSRMETALSKMQSQSSIFM